jgi:regulator of RNase E activity RraA
MNGPLSDAELEALRAVTTPTVCNAIETFDVRPRDQGFMDSSVACRFPEMGAMVGYAVTATIRAAAPGVAPVTPEAAWAEFEKTPRPWVVVIEDLDPQPVGSYWGEVNASVYRALGAVGTVTNGGVRDLPEVRAAGGFHFFSSCVLVSHAYVHLVQAGTPVNVGGLTVRPGDLLHGDQHGITSIPLEIAKDLPAAAKRIDEAERRLITHARSGEATAESLRGMYRRAD